MVADVYHTEDLKSNDFRDVQKFTFNGLLTKARVTQVYDGDTITIVFYYRDHPVKDSFRMSGYDAPELHPKKDHLLREKTIHAGEITRQYISDLVLDKVVWVKFDREEKYGRLMGRLYLTQDRQARQLTGTEVCVNDLMIGRGYGLPYNGGKKHEFTERQLDLIISSGR